MCDEPTTEATSPAPPTGESLIGKTIDRYKLLGVLGEGGFGVVYEAEQIEPVHRRVALKLVKAGMGSETIVTRFEAERQALALMEHECIAKIFDGGLTTADLGSRPYFVMELIRGLPITQHCDKHRLTIEERVSLLARVCDAVQHAHSHRIVHRDIKPSNILISFAPDGKPTPKVIDFGVAKALDQKLTEKTLFTERGMLVGTPEYMSPEQAEMDSQSIDARSDVYSLGVLLYELLTGMLPFSSEELRVAAFQEIQRVIREVDPPKPSTRLATSLQDDQARERLKSSLQARKADLSSLTRLFRSELDWVTMKCLDKRREDRYATAEALSLDLERFLRHEPVLARAPGIRRRLRRTLTRTFRSKRGLAAASAVFGVLATTSIVGFSGVLPRIAEPTVQLMLGPATTIDVRLEAIAAEELKREVVRLQARGGQAFAIDPVTGRVLCNVEYVLPSRADERPVGAIRRFEEPVFEPGSSLKPIVWACLTDADPDLLWPERAGGKRVTSYGRLIEDVIRRESLSWGDVLELSSNVALTEVADGLEPSVVLDFVERFGFGSAPGSDRNWEHGVIQERERASKYTVTSMALGHEIGATAAQMCRAYSALFIEEALQGTMVDLRTTSRRFTAEKPALRVAVVEPWIAGLAKDILRRNSDQYRRAAFDRGIAPESGVAFVGKSGTSDDLIWYGEWLLWVRQQGNVDGSPAEPEPQYAPLWIGAAPAEAPEIVMCVVLFGVTGEPVDQRRHYGSATSFNVFIRTMDRYFGHAVPE